MFWKTRRLGDATFHHLLDGISEIKHDSTKRPCLGSWVLEMFVCSRFVERSTEKSRAVWIWDDLRLHVPFVSFDALQVLVIPNFVNEARSQVKEFFQSSCLFYPTSKAFVVMLDLFMT